MRSSSFSTRDSCPPRIAGRSSCRRLQPMVLYASFTFWFVAPMARSEGETCNSGVCEIVAEVYDNTMNGSLTPCSNFFAYVCSGWLKSLEEKHARSYESIDTGTRSRLEKAADLILIEELNQLLRRSENTSLEEFLGSELQPAHFYQSCLLSAEKQDWELNTRNLRTFFNEIGLPFFDGNRTHGMSDDKKPTVLSTLLKLSLQFSIEPIFRIGFREDVFSLSKRSHLRSLPNDGRTSSSRRAGTILAIPISALPTSLFSTLTASDSMRPRCSELGEISRLSVGCIGTPSINRRNWMS